MASTEAIVKTPGMHFVRWTSLSVAFFLLIGFGSYSAIANDTFPAGHASRQPFTSAPASQIPQLTPETIADLLGAHQKYLGAITAYQKINPKTARIYNKMGAAYEHMLMDGDAKASFQRALKMDRKFAEAYNILGTLYYHQKDYHRAERLYKTAIKMNNQDAAFYSNLGALYFARNEFRNGAEAYQRAFLLNSNIFHETAEKGIPNNASLEVFANMHFCFAKIYAQAGKNELAIEYLRKAIMEGFHDEAGLQQDQEFAGLRGMPEFQKLISSERK
jgi:tetratricopeptide (TPR) repeat protein